jgi:rhodanese-related sulfurtransferase
VVTYCASGGRAALAAAMLQELGYENVRHMGGFKDWAEKGLPVEKG